MAREAPTDSNTNSRSSYCYAVEADDIPAAKGWPRERTLAKSAEAIETVEAGEAVIVEPRVEEGTKPCSITESPRPITAIGGIGSVGRGIADSRISVSARVARIGGW